MAIDTFRSVSRSAFSFLAGTAFSRVSGLARDMAMAISFGSSPEVAAFMVAYRLANLFRRLLGEGNLQAGFVPHFTEKKEEGAAFFRDVTYSLSFILLAVILFLELFLWVVSGWVGEEWRSCVELTMWMVPGLFFISLFGLNSALLQCRKKYFLPAVAPVLFNFVWIGAVLYKSDVYFLSMVMTVAFMGQWLMTAFEGARLLSFREWMRPKLFSPDFRVVLRALVLGIIGISAVQINSALDALFARVSEVRGPAFLWYAIRIEQLPLALFGIGLSGALLPSLARTEEREKRIELLQSALKIGGAIMLICTFGIFSLGASGINLIYGHGAFSGSDVMATTYCLWGYGLGLIPSVFVLLLSSFFYAEKNYKTPTFAATFSVGVNVFLNALFIFVFQWGAVSVAIATSLSALCNAIFLANGVFTKELWQFLGKVGAASLIGACLTWGLEWQMGAFSRDFFGQSVHFLSLSTIYLGSVIFLNCWFGTCIHLLNLLKPSLQKSPMEEK
jgi:putative peptidoglycan lipid II flippase